MSKLSHVPGGKEQRGDSRFELRDSLPAVPRKKVKTFNWGRAHHQGVTTKQTSDHEAITQSSNNVSQNILPKSRAEFDKMFPALPSNLVHPVNRRTKKPPLLDAGLGSLSDGDKEDYKLVGEALGTLNDILMYDDNVVSEYVKELKTKFFNSKTVFQGSKKIKEVSSHHRSQWILRGGSDEAAQCSFIGRALPAGSDEQVSAAIAQHKVDYSTEWTTHEYYLGLMTSFAKKWAKRHCKSADYLAPPDIPTLSSCMESTVRKGGLRAVWSNISEDFGYSGNVAARNMMYNPDMQIDLITMEKGCTALGKVPTSKVICLTERGLKTRVITKSPADLHFLGHVVRKRLVAGLKQTASSQSTLIGFNDDIVGDYFAGCYGDVCVSTDLTRASDLLPLDLVSALIDGLEQSGRFTSAEVESLRTMNGPQQLIYPDGSSIISKRGILMGLPTTWTLLSLVHMFWWDLAISQTDEEARIMSNTEDPDYQYYKQFQPSERVSQVQKDMIERSRRRRRHNKFMICGDDGLFVGSEEVSNRYLVVMSACGGIPSPGKHYISKPINKTSMETLSFVRGVFLERLFEFTLIDNKVTRANRHKAIPIRGLVRPDSPDNFRGGGVVKLSDGVKLMYSIDQVVQNHSRITQEPIKNWARRRPGLYRLSRESNLQDGVPVRFGGSGLPYLGTNRSVIDSIKMSCRKASYAIQHDYASFASYIRGQMDPNWASAVRKVNGEISRLSSDLIHLDLTHDTRVTPSRIAELNEDISNRGYKAGVGGYHFLGFQKSFETELAVKYFKDYSFNRTRKLGKSHYLNDKVFAKKSKDFWEIANYVVVPENYTEGSLDRAVFGNRNALMAKYVDSYGKKKGLAQQRAILFDNIVSYVSAHADSAE